MRESEITRELSRLHRATDILMKRMAEVENRLSPVMRGELPEKVSGDTPEESVNTPTGNSIREASRKIEAVSRAMGVISNRLEI
jgi:hypothetical protein